MGLHAHPQLIIGAILSPNELMINTPPTTVVCPNGHAIPNDGGPFCSKCGSKLIQGTTRTFKKEFSDYAMKMRAKPAQELYDEWVGVYDSDIEQLGFYKVEPVTCESAEDSDYVLGYSLANFECIECRLTNPIAIDIDGVLRLKRALFEILGDLDFVSRDIKLYLCARVSG